MSRSENYFIIIIIYISRLVSRGVRASQGPLLWYKMSKISTKILLCSPLAGWGEFRVNTTFSPVSQSPGLCLVIYLLLLGRDLSSPSLPARWCWRPASHSWGGRAAQSTAGRWSSSGRDWDCWSVQSGGWGDHKSGFSHILGLTELTINYLSVCSRRENISERWLVEKRVYFQSFRWNIQIMLVCITTYDVRKQI